MPPLLTPEQQAQWADLESIPDVDMDALKQHFSIPNHSTMRYILDGDGTFNEKSRAMTEMGAIPIPGPPDNPSHELTVVVNNGTVGTAAIVDDEIALEHFSSEDGRNKSWFIFPKRKQ